MNADNSVVIGSGILEALGLRHSNDLDVVVAQETYDRLKAERQFSVGENYGREVLTDQLFEIGTSWEVLGKDQRFEDLLQNSVVIDNVRYLTLEFILAVKESWLQGETARQKDVDDIALIRQYLASNIELANLSSRFRIG